MKIGSYLTSVILAALVGGIGLTAFFVEQHRSDIALSDTVTRDQLLQKDVIRLSNEIAAVIVNVDQILGTDNNLIVPSTLEQFRGLMLSTNFQGANAAVNQAAMNVSDIEKAEWDRWLTRFTTGSAPTHITNSGHRKFVQTDIELATKSDLVLHYKYGVIRNALSELQALIQEQSELQSVGVQREGDLNQLFDRSIDSSDTLFDAIEKMQSLMNITVAYRVRLLENTRSALLTNGFIASAVYVLLLVIAWTWCQRSISVPLTALNLAAQSATKAGVEFQVVAGGPREVRELEQSVHVFVASLEKARDEAIKASKFKGDFLANMSHELRTPLNAIIGYSEMLIEAAEDSGQQEFIDDLMKIDGAGKHLLSLISDVLDLSKIEAGKMDLYEEDFSIGDLIKDVSSMVENLVAKNSNQMVLEIGDDVGVMYADITKTRQILFNLLSNASKFTSQGTITVKVQRQTGAPSDWILFSVSDTGIGMSAEHMDSLFEKFTQADSATTRKYGGTGLGLALCLEFSHLMGGAMDVESELDVGTTFSVRLPTKMESNSTIEPSIESQSVVSDVILVIDDDNTVHELLQRTLSKLGFQMESAYSGEDGIYRAEKVRPAVIILDVMMPGMDGWDVLAVLGKHAVLHNTPVIMLTMTDDKARGYAMGVAGYLRKPAQRTDLANLLDRYVDRKLLPDILVVDDDPLMRDLLRRDFERLDCTVRESENGMQAIEEYGIKHPDLIVLDLLMPAMDGFQFVDYLREHHIEFPPIVVMTSKDVTLEDRQRLNGAIEIVLTKDNLRSQKVESVLEWLLCDWVPNNRRPMS